MPPTIYPSLREAIADFPDGASLMIPGFGPAGNPWNLLEALYEQGATGLTAIMNSANQRSADPALKSFTDLVAAGRVRKVVASFTASTHPSRPNVVETLAREGRIAVELTPQGTLAERIRAGGAGIPAFYTPAGVGTAIAEGKELRRFNGRPYLLETALTADYAFVRAWKADAAGNLVYRRTARNLNPIMAMAADCTIVEVEQPIVPAGALDPDGVHTPGAYVQRLVQIPSESVFAIGAWRRARERSAQG